jgi:hypothetical protein
MPGLKVHGWGFTLSEEIKLKKIFASLLKFSLRKKRKFYIFSSF